jgi:hypothetical protein
MGIWVKGEKEIWQFEVETHTDTRKKYPYADRGTERRTRAWEWPEQRFKIENGNFWQVSIRHEYNRTESDDPSTVYGNMHLPAIKHFPLCSAQSLSLPCFSYLNIFFYFVPKFNLYSYFLPKHVNMYVYTRWNRIRAHSAIPCYKTYRNTVPHIYTYPATFSFQDARHRNISQAIIWPIDGAPKLQ